MSAIATHDHELNTLIAAGRVVEGFERYYHDDVEMQENAAPPMVGKATNLEREKAFFGSATIHDIKLLGSGVGPDTSYSEWFMDLTLGNGYRMQLTQVAARKWLDGKVVRERFYYDTKAA